MTNQIKTKRLVETSLLLAIATVLSLFQPFQLPFGGGITIVSMLPIILIAYKYGSKWGLFAAFVGSLLQMLVGLKTVTAFFMPGDSQMVVWKAILVCLIDYVIAYTVLGFGGAFRNKFNATKALCLGSIFAIALRFLAHILSGYLFFGSWAEWFFSQAELGSFGKWVLDNMSGKGLALFYSVCYNATYIIPEMILTAVVAVIIAKIPVISKKANEKNDDDYYDVFER